MWLSDELVHKPIPTTICELHVLHVPPTNCIKDEEHQPPPAPTHALSIPSKKKNTVRALSASISCRATMLLNIWQSLFA
jgi:hypothetical protein